MKMNFEGEEDEQGSMKEDHILWSQGLGAIKTFLL
jgi:hypothetical protein